MFDFSISTSSSQRSVATALSRLGFDPQLEVQIFNGILTVDIVIELSAPAQSDSTSQQPERTSRVAIEFDGPTHFLRPAMGSRDDRVGPLNGKSRFRNTLIERSKVFSALVSIPFFEWDGIVGDVEKEGRYLLQKLS
jgi:hypothetical protein